MADLGFTDRDGIYTIVDVTTHREGARFNMPNLTSGDRLTRFYECDTNVFALLLIRHSIQGTTPSSSDVRLVPIEYLDWDCLTVGALGWCQIQIANANHVREGLFLHARFHGRLIPDSVEFSLERRDYFPECLLDLCETKLFNPANVRKVLCTILKEDNRSGES